MALYRARMSFRTQMEKKAPIDAKIPFRRSPSGEHRLPRIKGMHGNGILTSLGWKPPFDQIRFFIPYHIRSAAASDRSLTKSRVRSPHGRGFSFARPRAPRIFNRLAVSDVNIRSSADCAAKKEACEPPSGVRHIVPHAHGAVSVVSIRSSRTFSGTTSWCSMLPSLALCTYNSSIMFGCVAFSKWMSSLKLPQAGAPSSAMA